MSDDLSWLPPEEREKHLAWERKFKALGINRAVVRRKIATSFPNRKVHDIQRILDEYGSAEWHGERDRVQLAILKLADGNLDLLRKYLNEAKDDFRDVVTPAESPGFWKLGVQGFVAFEQMTEEQRAALLEADWTQFVEWLRSDERPGFWSWFSR